MAEEDFGFKPVASSSEEDFGFKPAKEKEPSTYQKVVPEPIKNAVGGIESAGRMLWNAPAGFIAQGLGHLTGMVGGDEDQGQQRGQEAAQRVSIPPLTEQGGEVDEALSHLYEYGKGEFVKFLSESDRKIYKAYTGHEMPDNLDNLERSILEGTFDAGMFSSMLKAGVKRVAQGRPAEVPPSTATKQEKIDPNAQLKEDYQSLEYLKKKGMAPVDVEATKLMRDVDPEKFQEVPSETQVPPPIVQPHEPTDVTLVRHGETKQNKDGNLRGWDDSEKAQLDDKGKEQAQALGDRHKDDQFSAIYTSDLGRAKETAEGLRAGREIPTLPTEGLRPWNVGELTGKDAEKAAPVLKDFAENKPDEPLPGGESFNTFKHRFLDTVSSILDKHEGENVAIVTHHRGERLFKAWDKLGRPKDYSIDMDTFQDFKKGVEPGKSEKMNIGPGKKQGGIIDKDLLTFGVRNLLNKEGFQKVMERFKGTFAEDRIDKAIKESTDPNSKTTVMFMSPEKFHELAMKREEGMTKLERAGVEHLRESKREDIRQGFKSSHGVDEIPELWLSHENSFSPGASVHSVWAHEGRHRADVLKEQGMDLMPVRVHHNDILWGQAARFNNLPRKVVSENGKFIDMPQPENWKNQPSPYDLDFTNKGKFGQGGAFNPKIFDRDSKKQGFVKTLLDARTQFQADKRTLPELISTWSEDKLKDISESFKATTNVMIDKTMSIMSEGKGGVGEAIKWVVDKMSDIDRRTALDIEKDLFGEKYKKTGGLGRPFETRIRGEEGILTNWKEAHKTREGKADLLALKDKAIENIGKDLQRQDFATERQFKIYDALQKGFTQLLLRVNDARAKINLGPIKRLPGYLPAKWEGDYRVHVYDGLNKHLMSFGFKNKYQGNAAVKALREAHPNLRVNDVEHVGSGFKNKYQREAIAKNQLGDLSAFEEAIRAFGKDDPISLALQKTMIQLRSSRGFGKHGLQKKGVLGFLGMEKGDIGVRNLERSIEQYVQQANRYISNIEKASVAADLDSIPLKFQEKIPNALAVLHEYIQNSRGADISREKLVGGIASTLSKLAGFGESAPLKILREGSSLASLYFLTTPRFVISQLAQHLNAFPKYVQLSGQGNFRNPVVSWFKGWQNFIKPDAQALEGANWAQRNGHLDSALVAMLEMKLGDFSFERSKLLKDAVSVSFGKLEKNAVRMPTFLAFEYGLRDSIKDANLRYETAANMMDYYMVHYGKTSRPLMYSKLGLTGEAISTFKQYSHNGWGQFFEYVNYSLKEGGDVAPLLTHVGMQVAVGGLKGAVLMAEAAMAISVLNVILAQFDVQIPDPQDLLMNSNIHDFLVFGGLSTVLGADVSSSVNAPNVPQMFSAPSVQFTYSAIKDAVSWGMKALAGTATEQDEMKAALSLAPSAMRGWIEELFSTPGEPVPKPGQKMKGNYLRTDDPGKGILGALGEKTMAKWFSLKSLPEARVNADVNAFKKEIAQDLNAKVSALDAIVDRIHEGKEIDDNLMQRFINNGGNPSHLAEAIKKRMIERNLDFADRQIYNKHMTPAQAHKLETMKQLLDQKYKNEQEKQNSKDDFGFKPKEEQKEDFGFKPMAMGMKPNVDVKEPKVVSDSQRALGRTAGSQVDRYNKLYRDTGIPNTLDEKEKDFTANELRKRRFRDTHDPDELQRARDRGVRM